MTIFSVLYNISLWLIYFIHCGSLIAQLIKNPPAVQETPVQVLGLKDLLETDPRPTSVLLGFPGGSAGKQSATVWKTWVQSLGWEDPLEKGKATHYSILAWRIPWTI